MITTTQIQAFATAIETVSKHFSSLTILLFQRLTTNDELWWRLQQVSTKMAQILTFHPTITEFADFEKYVQKMEAEGGHSKSKY